jgi:hypothetical protein
MPIKSPIQLNQRSLPNTFRPFFWSYRFDSLDPRRDKKTVIVQLINYGTLAHWGWLVREYGVGEIRRTLQSVQATEINPATRALASLLFSISHWRNAPRGSH